MTFVRILRYFKSDRGHDFLQRVRILAMQTAVIPRGCLSVCPSVTFRCFVQTTEDTAVFSVR